MDRSFLADASVVEASRDFVCMRLATYEDAKEAEYLKTIFTRRGALENTVFAILGPDGESQLARPGRRPSFRTPQQMAARMREIVNSDFSHATRERGSDPTLPVVKSLDLALNVASCDGLPMIVAVGESQEELASFRKSLVPIAWDEELAGQFVFATALGSDDLRPLTGLDGDDNSGIFIVEPDRFGVSGDVVQKLARDSQPRAQQLKTFLAGFTPPQKSHQSHVQAGFSLGLKWETEIPVTDSQAVRASERLWGPKD